MLSSRSRERGRDFAFGLTSACYISNMTGCLQIGNGKMMMSCLRSCRMCFTSLSRRSNGHARPASSVSSTSMPSIARQHDVGRTGQDGPGTGSWLAEAELATDIFRKRMGFYSREQILGTILNRCWSLLNKSVMGRPCVHPFPVAFGCSTHQGQAKISSSFILHFRFER